MFLLIISIILGAIGYGFWRWYKKASDGGSYGDADGQIVGLIICLLFAVVTFMASFIHTGVQYSKQIGDIEQITRTVRTELILAEKRNQLQKQLDDYLDNKYIKHEKSIFAGIGKNQKMLAAAYPNLTAFKTIISLTETIKKLQDDYYNQRVLREKILARIRFRVKDPWAYYFLIPEYTKE